MNADTVIYSVAGILLALMLLVEGLAGAKGILRKNIFTGLRLKSTMDSDDAWRAGHRALIPWGIITSIISGATFLLLVITKMTSTPINYITRWAPYSFWVVFGIFVFSEIPASRAASRASSSKTD